MCDHFISTAKPTDQHSERNNSLHTDITSSSKEPGECFTSELNRVEKMSSL